MGQLGADDGQLAFFDDLLAATARRWLAVIVVTRTRLFDRADFSTCACFCGDTVTFSFLLIALL